jgi:hypothetical protein
MTIAMTPVHNTNRVESFWRLFKKSVASTHIHISSKYADRYLGEFAPQCVGRVRHDLLGRLRAPLPAPQTHLSAQIPWPLVT